MANRISFYVGGNKNRKLKPRNMSTHLIETLLTQNYNGGIPKVMSFKYLGKVITEEQSVKLTGWQHAWLVRELERRVRR